MVHPIGLAAFRIAVLLAAMPRDDRYLERLSRMPRQQAREEIVRKLEECLPDLAAVPVVADALCVLGIERAVLIRYTFDEPLVDGPEAQVQFTYHLGDHRATSGATYQEEVRGSGIAVFLATGAVRLDDVDAEIYRLVDEAEIPADD